MTRWLGRAKPSSPNATCVLLVKSPNVAVITMAELLGTSSRLVAVVGPMKVSPCASVETDAMKKLIAVLDFMIKTFLSLFTVIATLVVIPSNVAAHLPPPRAKVERRNDDRKSTKPQT